MNPPEAKLWRLYMIPGNGDFGIQRNDAGYPIDVAGAMRVIVDESFETANQADNRSRFTSPKILLQKKNDTHTNVSTFSLLGTNGEHLEITSPYINGQVSDIYISGYTSSGTAAGLQFRGSPNSVDPQTNNLTCLGRAGHVWYQVAAGTGGFITPSDKRLKQNIQSIPDKILDVWSEVEAVQFEYQGEPKKHFGFVAQDVVEIFKKHNLDVIDLGIVTYDKWEEDKAGNGVVTPAGDAYGMRYDEASVLSNALMKRELKRLRSIS